MEAVYQLMINSAAQKCPTFRLSQELPSADDVIVNNGAISGAFTKTGWEVMQKFLAETPRFFKTEDWMVKLPRPADPAVIRQLLQRRYQEDFIRQWTSFLDKTQVVPCRNRTPGDAVKRLTSLSAPQSPLLGLFCVVAQNVEVDSTEVKNTFQPVRSIVPGDCQKQYSGAPNREYLDALFAMKEAVQPALTGMNPVDIRAGITPQMTAARTASHHLESNFQVSSQWPVDRAVSRLLEEPISGVEPCLSGMGVGPLCDQFRTLKEKYPFLPRAKAEASLQEVDSFFHPNTGFLWSFVDQGLKGILLPQSSGYVRNPAALHPAPQTLLTFVNGSARIRDALYANGATHPQVRLSIRVNPLPAIAAITVRIDGQPRPSTVPNQTPGILYGRVHLMGRQSKRYCQAAFVLPRLQRRGPGVFSTSQTT